MDVRLRGDRPGRPTLLSVCFQYPDGSGGNITTTDSAASTLTDGGRGARRVASGRRTIALAAPEAPFPCATPPGRGHGSGALRVAAADLGGDGRSDGPGFFVDVDLLALNEDEAAALAGVAFDPATPEHLLDACARRLTAAQPAMRIVVSAGPHGAFGFEGGRWEHSPSLKVPVASTAGAGDALLGGVLTALALGVPFTVEGAARKALTERPAASALDFGVLVAAFKVTSRHTIHPDVRLASLLAFARDHGLSFAESLRRHF